MNKKIVGSILIITILFLLVYIFVIPLLFSDEFTTRNNSAEVYDLEYCEKDNDCAVTKYPIYDCCMACDILPINKQGLELQEKWREKECDRDTLNVCPLLKCIRPDLTVSCIENKCQLPGKEAWIAEQKCKSLEIVVNMWIDEVKTCNLDSDCFVDTSIILGCPLGCHFIRSKKYNNSEQLFLLEEKLKQYKNECATCKYNCISSPDQEDIKCQNNKCVDIKSVALTQESEHFIIYSYDKSLNIEQIINLSENAYLVIAKDMDTVPSFDGNKKIEIYLYQNQNEYSEATKRPHYSSGCIKTEKTEEQYTKLEIHHMNFRLGDGIPHELTHIIFRDMFWPKDDNIGHRGIPKWIEEGFAVYEGQKFDNTYAKNILMPKIELFKQGKYTIIREMPTMLSDKSLSG
ncbi:MAG: hypothetical protein KAQ92_06070, partial [Candidatus Aenigmarchaeota archaeon]|nr:hypothetical protein [Candidatus Aenigmarchaeota archaeon]